MSNNDSIVRTSIEIPYIVLDKIETPYALKLYTHLKRVCGDDGGTCWQSEQTLAIECKISRMSIARAKQELLAVGLIRIVKGRWGSFGNRRSDEITLIEAEPTTSEPAPAPPATTVLPTQTTSGVLPAPQTIDLTHVNTQTKQTDTQTKQTIDEREIIKRGIAEWNRVFSMDLPTKPTANIYLAGKQLLDDGYTEQQLLQAITGITYSDFWMGKGEHSHRKPNYPLTVIWHPEKIREFLVLYHQHNIENKKSEAEIAKEAWIAAGCPGLEVA